MNTKVTAEFDKAAYDALAKEYRYLITDMICRAGSGHLGGALSLVEIVITLYHRIMRVKPDEPRWEGRDRLVMSKGHAGPVLYVALADKGFFPESWLGTLNADGTRLPSHVTPGIDMSAGSLGQGLSCASGIALAAKMNKQTHTVFCIIGDGESNEGQIWEGAFFAGHHKLDNLVAICDYNKLQIDGFTEDILTLEPLVEKWRACNWEVFEMDGHDWDDIYDTIQQAIAVQSKPAMIIAHTIKAKGNALFENTPDSHNINVGVSEANMICVGAGLANEGKIPFCATFTCFASRRVYDQITISVAYANNNVKIVGTAPGITAGPNGGTHMCFQDLGIMRAMPNMHVYSPCDAYELRSMLKHMASHKQPTYMQLIRSKMEPIFDESYQFDPNKAVVLREGGDVTLVATGYMTSFALKAAGQLKVDGIAAEVLYYPSVKPFDADTLVASAKKTGAVVTVETQNIIGGLGGAVCETLSEQCPTRVKRLGVPDKFGEVATEAYLFTKHGFGIPHIIAACKAFIK